MQFYGLALVRCLRQGGALILIIAGGMLAIQVTQAAERLEVESREEFLRAVESAQPGTTILLAAGDYAGGFSFSRLQGTEERPIIIEALDPQRPPVIRGGGTCLQLSNPQHVYLRNLVLVGGSGNGLNIDDGGDYSTPAHHVWLENVSVRDIGPRGNRDAIKLSGLNDFRITECSLERWGDAGSGIDMVGCHRGEIDHCTLTYEGDLAANGIQTKGGSSEIAIRYCRFEHAGSRALNIGGSTGLAYFRPRGANYEARDILVEDCTLIGSTAPIAFVGVDGATVRYNTIYRPAKWIARILQESTGPQFLPCRNGRFEHNLIVFSAEEVTTAVNVGSGTDPDSFHFANNYWHCLDRAASVRLQLPVDELDPQYGPDPQFMNPRELDLRLRPESPVESAGVRHATGDKASR